MNSKFKKLNPDKLQEASKHIQSITNIQASDVFFDEIELTRKYNIFLDDQVFEINTDDGSIIRDPKKYYPGIKFSEFNKASDAIKHMEDTCCPSFISFDHDLCEFDKDNKELTGFTVAQWMIEKDLDNNGTFIPEDFSFAVHSKNPIGRKKIEDLLNAYLKSKKNG